MGTITETITLNTTLKRSDTILVQNLDEDVVMANIDSGHYFGIDRTGRRIWELLESPATVTEICAGISREYAVDAATCEQEVLAFVNELAQEGLIQVV